MAGASTIEWTDATWNPVRGCSRVSPGCGGPNHEGGCYAEKIAARFSDPGQTFHGFAERTPHGGRWTGKLALIDKMLTVPLHWKKPRRIFVNSMSDLFHENLPDEAIDKVFAVMALCPQHTFQVLTKRAERMLAYFADLDRADMLPKRVADPAIRLLRSNDPRYLSWKYPAWPLPNVWLGVSTERQQEADERIPLLLQTPAAVRFISAEPLLGPIDLTAVKSLNVIDRSLFSSFEATRIAPLDWVIVGGESGPNARPMHPQWARDIEAQCRAAGVPFFFKQWGAWAPGDWDDDGDCMFFTPLDPGIKVPDLSHHKRWKDRIHFFVDTPQGLGALALGKKSAGRLLDGKEHNGFPQVRT
jgi:protein gp37